MIHGHDLHRALFKLLKPALTRRQICWLFCALAITTVRAATDTNEVAELKKLSLEELMNQQVSIVFRRGEKLSESPSAVQVVTGEDIQRSGATTLPEALRLAPNLQVAQVDSGQWAISARGFNNLLANKLLVMIDGRTVYTPLFAGVFWDVQSTLLADIDRIEVVSGPGATLWGQNAVNGVINILTKSAQETQGLLIEGAGGTQLRDFGAIRYGGSAGSNVFFRVYAQRLDHNSTLVPNRTVGTNFIPGTEATNAWGLSQGGFRTDWTPEGDNVVTVQGDAYGGAFERAAPGDITVDGQNVLGRWTHSFSEESDLTAQAYFDRTWRRTPDVFAEDLKTYDLDFQHRWMLGQRNNITWGAGYRLMQDQVQNTPTLAFQPAHRNLELYSGFVQDEISLVPERLAFTIGTKLEHNDYSGFEVEPSARIAWTPDKRQTVWAAVSRAVRTPSRGDSDVLFPGTPPFLLIGGTNFTSEKVLAYEIGYRVRPIDRLSLAVATYYNFYDDVRSLEPIATNSFVIANGNRAESWGVELSGNYQVTDWWRLRGGYTFLHKTVARKEGSLDLNRGRAEGNDPPNQVVVQSMMDLPAGFQLDSVARYVDELPDPHVPAYFAFDLRAAWRYKDWLELSVVGQNLWHNQHSEFGASGTREEIPRSVYGKVTFQF